MEIVHAAVTNMTELAENPYPGRIVAIGRPSEAPDSLLMLTAIMGRSENSRNRVYSAEGGRIFTEAADPSKIKDPSLIIYNAMDELAQKGVFVASNGDQTDTAIHFLRCGAGFAAAMNSQGYEPDAPNFTPRITVVYDANLDIPICFASLRRSPWGESCERHCSMFADIPVGYGYYLRTYEGDGNPLPSFRRDPLLLPFTGTPARVMMSIWEALNPEHRVGLAGKLIDTELWRSTVLPPINRFQKVAQ